MPFLVVDQHFLCIRIQLLTQCIFSNLRLKWPWEPSCRSSPFIIFSPPYLGYTLSVTSLRLTINITDKTLTDYIQFTKGTVLASCSDSYMYIGETMTNVQLRFDKHTNSRGDSEPACHLCVNPLHSFSWGILCMAPSTTNHRILKYLLIQQWKTSLNRQVHCF